MHEVERTQRQILIMTIIIDNVDRSTARANSEHTSQYEEDNDEGVRRPCCTPESSTPPAPVTKPYL